MGMSEIGSLGSPFLLNCAELKAEREREREREGHGQVLYWGPEISALNHSAPL